MATITKTDAKLVRKSSDMVSDGWAKIEELIDILRERFDNRSERWQESERGEELESLIDQLEEWKDTLEDISGELYDLSENLEI